MKTLLFLLTLTAMPVAFCQQSTTIPLTSSDKSEVESLQQQVDAAQKVLDEAKENLDQKLDEILNSYRPDPTWNGWIDVDSYTAIFNEPEPLPVWQASSSTQP